MGTRDGTSDPFVSLEVFKQCEARVDWRAVPEAARALEQWRARSHAGKLFLYYENGKCACRVVFNNGFNEFVEVDRVVGFTTAGSNKFKCRQRVARASSTLHKNLCNRFWRDRETRIANNKFDVFFEVVHGQ